MRKFRANLWQNGVEGLEEALVSISCNPIRMIWRWCSNCARKCSCNLNRILLALVVPWHSIDFHPPRHGSLTVKKGILSSCETCTICRWLTSIKYLKTKTESRFCPIRAIIAMIPTFRKPAWSSNVSIKPVDNQNRCHRRLDWVAVFPFCLKVGAMIRFQNWGGSLRVKYMRLSRSV